MLGFKSTSTKMRKMGRHKHFQGKEVIEHLRMARKKGAQATEETHGIEMSGSLFAFVDSVKDSSILVVGLSLVLSQCGVPIGKILMILSVFSVGWLFWKIGRSCLLAWSRLERFHRLIGEERFEIEHNRLQEREELSAIYQQKGLSGVLLNQVVDVLMADDNRLLQIMLEEELGLALESCEHPLKQAVGAGLGVITVGLGMGIGVFFGGLLGLIFALGLLFSSATLIASNREGNEASTSLVWNLSVAVLAMGSLYFIAQWISHALP